MKMNVGFQFGKLVRLNLISLAKRTVVTQGGVKNGSIISPFLSCETGFNKHEFIKSRTSCLMSDKNIYLSSEIISNLSVKDSILRSSIAEPGFVTEINIGLPFIDSVKNDLNLPSVVQRELIEPTSNVVEKKAKKSIIRIRRRKMRRHKWKKLQKKMKYVFARIRKQRRAKREKEFMALITNIIDSGKNYNPEKELEENVEQLKWERPVTHIRGYLAPKSVVEQYLKEEQMKNQIKERVEECLKKL